MKNVAWVFVFVFCCSFVFAAYSDDGKYISRYDVDNETACGCSIAGAYLMWGSPSDITASCTYYHEPEDTVEGAQINYLHASFTNWDDAEDTKDVMESHKEKYASDLGRTEKSDSWVAVERFVNKDSFSLITRPVKVGNEYRNGDKKQFSYEVFESKKTAVKGPPHLPFVIAGPVEENLGADPVGFSVDAKKRFHNP